MKKKFFTDDTFECIPLIKEKNEHDSSSVKYVSNDLIDNEPALVPDFQ